MRMWFKAVLIRPYTAELLDSLCMMTQASIADTG